MHGRGAEVTAGTVDTARTQNHQAGNRGGPVPPHLHGHTAVSDGPDRKGPASGPEQLANDLAAPIRRLAADPALRLQLAAGARERVARIGLWPNKVAWLTELYAEIESSTQPQIEEVC